MYMYTSNIPTLSAWLTLAPCFISMFTIAQCPSRLAINRGDAPSYDR